MDQKEIQQKSLFKMHIYPSTCPFFYNSNFLLFVINPKDQPLIKSIPTKDILFVIVQSLAQRRSNTTTTNHNKSNLPSLEIDDERRKTYLCCFRILLTYLAFHHPTFQTFIQCHSFPSHPQLGADQFYVIHKQTRLPTHAHKFS